MSASLSKYRIMGNRIICQRVEGVAQAGEVSKIGGGVMAGKYSPGDRVYFTSGALQLMDGLFVINESQIWAVWSP